MGQFGLELGRDQPVVKLFAGGFESIEVAVGGADLLAELFNRVSELGLADVGNDDRRCFATGICPDHPEFVAHDQVLNQQGVGIRLEDGLGIADRAGGVVAFLDDAIAVLAQGLSEGVFRVSRERVLAAIDLLERLEMPGILEDGEEIGRVMRWFPDLCHSPVIPEL